MQFPFADCYYNNARGEWNMSMVDVVAADTRLCNNCVEQKSLSNFRPRNREGSLRHNECSQCHNARERLRRAAKKDRELQAFVKALAARRDASVVVNMSKVIVRSFGGLHGFAEEWNRQQKRAMTESPTVAYRFLMASLKIMELASRFDR